MRGPIRIALSLWLVLIAAGPSRAADFELPQGPGRDLVYGQCRTCHDLQYLVDSAGITREDWAATIDNMRQYGLRVPAETRARILDYLATYLGPNPPKAPEAAGETAPADGATIYAEQCAACHQENGKGIPEQVPPLAGNRDLFLDPTFPVLVVLYGLEGPVDVAGRRFDAAMPPFAHLSDAEIAAVVGHVRTAWGNDALAPAGMVAPDAAAVAEARRKEMTPEAVRAYRAARK